MSEKDGFRLSRRKALAGIGGIGIASAGAGIGTSAYFSDTESFDNNSITAGELDLKVDWEEHYYNGKGNDKSEATMADDPASADYFLPAIDVPEDADFIGELGNTPISAMDARPIALNFTNSQNDFWDATAIEAYPDTDEDGDANDGSQDPIPGGETACEYLADVGGDVAGGLDPSGPRSDNADTRLADESAAPLINLQDVKPGDFGEVTFSFHLCDNPGYVWFQGDSIEAAENGHTEPELEDKDEITHNETDPEERNLFAEEGTFDEDGNLVKSEPVELLDNILTRMWYDDGNNQVDRISGQVDVMCAIDTSGSLDTDEQQNLENGVNEFINALANSNADVNLGTVEFGGGGVRNKNDLTVLTEPGDLDISISSFGGNTPMPGAMDIADKALYNDGKARSGAEKVLVLFSDGGPNYLNTSYTEDYTAPRDNSEQWSASSGDSTYDNAGTGDVSQGQPGGGQVTKGEMDETAIVAESIRESGTGGGETTIATVFAGGAQRDSMSDNAINEYDTLPKYMETEIASDPGKALQVPDTDDLEDLAQDIVGLVSTTEEVFFLGTLRQALQTLSDGHGVPLTGDVSAENGGGTGRNCFSAENTHYIGFEWWVPINHGNQIQGDSVSFDIGFYTEQCRHNDGEQAAD